ncbi:replication-associated recombination protein A [Limnochorda pilosa]|uniref:ATPase AAA n=1 Tax=Limnochorda pilosa TaxID=1555112 RepID=A0A0K2SNP4_LIMPI|nr:replication-associated recombination protein A [Limnochorda pilosa]BAS28454.1 ATPase AAA [Limnochorda pilosa]
MDLFEAASRGERQRQAPLAARMRPETLDELVGQGELVGPGRPLRVALEGGRLGSMILYGPPGTGKTTLAHLIARRGGAHFEQLNAVTSGVADLRRVIQEAAERWRLHGRRTVLFIDEIHRFNKAQQDALLPAVEDGTVLLVGATTENPFFQVNSPLLSRCRLFRLRPLAGDDVRALVLRALASRQGLEGRLELDPPALERLVRSSAGDARRALNGLETAAWLAEQAGRARIEEGDVEAALQEAPLLYDRQGDQHYDVFSAFIKSMRGSDPDATLHYLVRMLEAGEDPRAIARRIVIHASEDVGNADPQALQVAVAAAHALELVGLPEAALNLAQAALYVATAPKSNATYRALAAARQDLKEKGWAPVPPHLRDASYPGARQLGHGEGYLYPHDFPGHHVPQPYLPENLAGRRYYEPSDQGYEKQLARRLAAWREGRSPEPG